MAATARVSGRVRDLVNENVPKEVAWIGGGWRMKIDIKLTVDNAACRVWPRFENGGAALGGKF